MHELQNLLMNENFVLGLAIGVPFFLTVVFGLVFWFGFRKPKSAVEIAPLQKLPQEIAEAPKKAPAKAGPRELADSMALTRLGFFGRIQHIFTQKSKLSAHELEELEEILYTSDLGPLTVQKLMAAVEHKLKVEGASGFESVREALKSEMLDIFMKSNDSADLISSDMLSGLNLTAKPSVIMVVGVNGAGKTTSIGKISSLLALRGQRVLVAAGDTFRAAAGSQLKVWTDRAQVEIFSPEGVSDPSAVAFDACSIGVSKTFDVVIIDTAGRLHTQKGLMEELKKMKRVIQKVIPAAPHETLLVLDASSGQNALQQAREFHAALEISGVVLTKLDGTAKGGVAVGLAHELNIPIKLIGVGEGIEDLRPFQAREFVNSII